jgi:hypothetical protein
MPGLVNAIEYTWVFSLSKTGTDEDFAEFSIWTYDSDYGPDDSNLLDLAHGAWKAWHDNIPTDPWTDNVFLSYVKGRTFAANGHTLREQIYVPDVGWQGSGSHPALPWETSLCLSLYTYPRGSFVTQGRRKRGRVYLPPMRSGVLDSSNSGFFSDGALSALFTNLTHFVSRVGQDGLGVQNLTPVVYSRADNMARPIIQCSIDAKFDSQRRRQNREVAGHLELPLG